MYRLEVKSEGCVNYPHTARRSQKAGFTQPRAYLIAQLCRYLYGTKGEGRQCLGIWNILIFFIDIVDCLAYS